jgi:hypothetical protein
VLEAMRRWQALYGREPSSYDWSSTHARQRGGQAAQRLRTGEWPAPATVTALFASWPAARREAFGE